MGTALQLGDAIRQLASLDQDATIFAAEPWTHDSETIVAIEPDSGGIPDEVAQRGLKYFLEVSVAREVLEGLGINTGPQADRTRTRRQAHPLRHR